MKPNLNFLRKVADRKVCIVSGYTERRGGYQIFRGGEATYEKHRKAGFVTRVPTAELGRPGYVELTDAGRDALLKAEAK